jgi:hypothetical protein
VHLLLINLDIAQVVPTVSGKNALDTSFHGLSFLSNGQSPPMQCHYHTLREIVQ